MRAGRPSPSLVISLIALLVALSGTAVALSRNSVGPKELKPNAVRSGHVKANALKGRDIREASLAPVPQALNARALRGARACLAPALQIDGGTAERILCEAGDNHLMGLCGDTVGGIRAQVWRRVGGAFTLLATADDAPGGGATSGPSSSAFVPGSTAGGVLAHFIPQATATAPGVGTCRIMVFGAAF